MLTASITGIKLELMTSAFLTPAGAVTDNEKSFMEKKTKLSEVKRTKYEFPWQTVWWC